MDCNLTICKEKLITKYSKSKERFIEKQSRP